MKRSSESCNHKIFISYCEEHTNLVTRIADELEKLNYKIMLNIEYNSYLKLYSEVSKAINDSDIMICFIDKNYCESDETIKEITYASKKKKKILPIILDENSASNGVDFIICTLQCFSAYKHPNTFLNFDHQFEKLKSLIYETVNKECVECNLKSKMIKIVDTRSENIIPENQETEINNEVNFNDLIKLKINNLNFSLVHRTVWF